jgi:hypothetical protein
VLIESFPPPRLAVAKRLDRHEDDDDHKAAFDSRLVDEGGCECCEDAGKDLVDLMLDQLTLSMNQ